MDKDKGSCSTPAAGSCGTPAAGACSTTAGSCGPGGKEKCCGKMIISSLVGGIVMFAWISLSWMVLPLHKGEIQAFKDEKAVAAVIAKNIAGDGTYSIPYTNMGKLPQKTAKPYAYVVVKADGIDMVNGMKEQLIKEFVLCLFLAGFLACLLKKTAGGCCPVFISFKVGLIAGLAGYLPNYIWFHFPLNSALMGVLETLVGFTLAGLVMAKCILKMPIGKAACGAGACSTDKK